MKMNNTIFADENGIVCEIHIKEGDVVGKDALMMEFAEQE
jgi:biotin carboxyl carrier protein